MLPTPIKRNTSLYDSLPNLDSWYEKKHDESKQVVPCNKQRKTTCSATVSFSTAPPAVYHYQERPNHRRTSSSEHGKTINLFD